MILYLLYDATGEILQNGLCPEGMEPQLPGAFLLHTDSYVSELEYYVLYGRLEAYTAEQSALKSNPPAYGARWDNANMCWIDTRSVNTMWADVRAERDKRLAACDWTQLADAPAESAQVWRGYRQALRNVTKQANPASIEWPQLPHVLT